MSIVPVVFGMVLAINAIIAICIAMFWQAKVILSILGMSDWKIALNPLNALSNQNGAQSTCVRFLTGKILPDLRRKWLKAIGYAAISMVTLLVVTGLFHLVVPEFLS